MTIRISVWQSQNWFEGGITATTNLVGREVVHSATSIATQKVKQAWSWFSGNLVRKNVPHALDKMQDRGFMPSVIENVINNGKEFPTKIGTVGFYDPINNIKVITNSQTGQVVTTIWGIP